jgi:hypothetical protein
MYPVSVALRRSKVVRVSKLVVLCASITFALFVVGSVALAAVINGTAGDNTLNGTNQSDSIFGYGGNDTINGRGGQDELWGGFDSDTVYGQGSNDTLHGEGGNDTLQGGPGNDELRGADGVDILNGGANDDRLYDRDGNAAERDRFNCGKGELLILVSGAAAASAQRSPVRIRFPDHVGDATGEVVFGTPSQVVLDRAYRETGVVDVSGTPGAVADLRCRFDLPFQRVQKLEDAGRDPRAYVPRAVSVASRHGQERVDHVRDVD